MRHLILGIGVFLARLPERLHREIGGLQTAEAIMLIAAISIPLIVVLGAFGDDITRFLSNEVCRLKPAGTAC